MNGIGTLLSGLGGGGGGLLSQILGGTKLGLSGFGIINQIMQARQRQDLINRTLDYQKHPEKIMALAHQFQQPLEQGLVSGVGNNVQGYLAQRGLSQSPNIQADVLAQSLAPFQQQNMQRALQLALATIGLPGSMLPYVGTEVTGGLASLLATLSGGKSGQPTTADAGGFQYDPFGGGSLSDFPGSATPGRTPLLSGGTQ